MTMESELKETLRNSMQSYDDVVVCSSKPWIMDNGPQKADRRELWTAYANAGRERRKAVHPFPDGGELEDAVLERHKGIESATHSLRYPQE